MFNEDTSVFFNDFSEDVYFSYDGQNHLINGILDRVYSEALDIPGFIPSFSYSKKDYKTPVVGLIVETSDKRFEVVSIDDDYTGIINLHLREL